MRVPKEYLVYLLFPLALFYWGVVYWRNWFYRYGFFVSRHLPCQVISIGNITAGGTGKTPTTIFIAQYLKKGGKRVAILSRGYGRKTKGTLLVSEGKGPKCNWTECGDEPYLIAKKICDVPIVVDEDRYRGGTFLMEKFNPEIILLDDGFQHRAIERDLDLVLVNGGDKTADHKLLPYGYLREPWTNIQRADAITITKVNLKKPKSFLVRKIRETNKPLLFATANVFLSEFNTEKHLTINNLVGKNVFAVSALGDKAGFELTVKLTGGLICGQISFPDHHEYNQHEWDEVESQVRKTKSEYIITTEKDWVKLMSVNVTLSIIVLGLDMNLYPVKKVEKLLSRFL
ncbi:MAG: tetraacyldisaccharide 4'-kinase [Candidatus Neomarinimicrobiota bacterium]|nr:tetraacyldisaccharide 4'-kinase [Candidatus Neomarinimicrobiota bacterium]